MKKNILTVCLAFALVVPPCFAEEPEAVPTAGTQPDTPAWVRVWADEDLWGSGCEVKAHPGGFLEVFLTSGSGIVHDWEYLLARQPDRHQYQILFFATSVNGAGESITVKGATVEYHFNRKVRMGCGRTPGTVVTYPLSAEGAKAWEADFPKYHEPTSWDNFGKAMAEDAPPSAEDAPPPAVESEDGSLLLLPLMRNSLLVRCGNGVDYSRVALLDLDKPVQSISREGDVLILRATGGSECRIPLDFAGAKGIEPKE